MSFRKIFLYLFILFNVVSLAPLEFYAIQINDEWVYIIPFIFLAGYALSWPVVFLKLKLRPFRSRDPASEDAFNDKLLQTPTLAIMIFYACGLVWMNRSGVVASDFDARFGNSPIVFLSGYLLMIFLLVKVATAIAARGKISGQMMAAIGIYLVGTLLLGYRSPIAIFIVATVFIYVNTTGAWRPSLKLTLKHKAAIGAIALVLMAALSLFSQYRTALKYDLTRFYYKEYRMDELPWMLRGFADSLALVREDQRTVERLVNWQQRNGSLNGELFLSNFETLLPGEQLGARNLVGSLTTTRVTAQGKAWSITPSQQGALFVDGGPAIVFLGGLIAGVVLGLLDAKMRARPTALFVAVGSFVGVNILLIIHTGYLDLNFYIVLAAFFIIKWFLSSIYRDKSPRINTNRFRRPPLSAGPGDGSSRSLNRR